MGFSSGPQAKWASVFLGDLLCFLATFLGYTPTRSLPNLDKCGNKLGWYLQRDLGDKTTGGASHTKALPCIPVNFASTLCFPPLHASLRHSVTYNIALWARDFFHSLIKNALTEVVGCIDSDCPPPKRPGQGWGGSIQLPDNCFIGNDAWSRNSKGGVLNLKTSLPSFFKNTDQPKAKFC